MFSISAASRDTLILLAIPVVAALLVLGPVSAVAQTDTNHQVVIEAQILEVDEQQIEEDAFEFLIEPVHQGPSVPPPDHQIETELLEMELNSSGPIPILPMTPQEPPNAPPTSPIDVEILPLEMQSGAPVELTEPSAPSNPPSTLPPLPMPDIGMGQLNFETGDIPTENSNAEGNTAGAAGVDEGTARDNGEKHPESSSATESPAPEPTHPKGPDSAAHEPTGAKEDKTQKLSDEEKLRRRYEAERVRNRAEWAARQDMGRDPVPIGGQLPRDHGDPAQLSDRIDNLDRKIEYKEGQTRTLSKETLPSDLSEPPHSAGIAPITGSTVVMTTPPCPTGEKIDIHLVDKDVYTPILYPGSTSYTDLADIVSKLTALVGANYDPTGRCGKCMRNINIWGHGSTGGGYIAFGPSDGVAGNGQGATDLSGATSTGLQAIKGLMCNDGHIYLNMCEAGKGAGGDNAMQRVADLTGVPVSAPEGSISGCRVFGGALTSYKTKKPPPPPPPLLLLAPATSSGASGGIAPVTGSSTTQQ